MATTPQNAAPLPQIDMSTSVPLNQPIPDQASTALPKIDMSTSVPLDSAIPASAAPTVGQDVIKAVAGPTTALGAPTPSAWTQEGSGVSDILHGNFGQGASKIWEAEKPHVIQGSFLEKAIQKLDPSFQGSATPAEADAALASRAIVRPTVDVAQFIDKDAHPAGKALAETAQSFTSPATVATLYSTGGLGLVESPARLAIASRLLSGGFSAAAIASAYKNLQGFKEAYDKGDSSEAMYQLTHAITSGLLGVFAARGAASSEPIITRTDTSDVADAAGTPASRLRTNPFRATSKIEPAATALTAKAGLAPGEVGLTAEEAAQKTAQSALEAKAATQVNVDQALQNIAARHATENGLQAPTAGTASRDLITNSGNALVDAGKADYKIVDKFTDGKFTNAQNELKNARFELQQKAGTTSADTSALEANVIRAQMNVDNLFDAAVENGMPKETAEAARTKFRIGQATLDVGHDVRMANRVRGAAGERTTDLNALENRWTARYDDGRLQQAFGEDGAKDALAAVHAARETGEIFESLHPTESQALRGLIQKNTTTSTLGTKTDWVKVRNDFSSLPDRGAQFSDVPKVESFINRQVLYQRLRTGVKAALGVAATGALGTLGVEAAKAVTE